MKFSSCFCMVIVFTFFSLTAFAQDEAPVEEELNQLSLSDFTVSLEESCSCEEGETRKDIQKDCKKGSNRGLLKQTHRALSSLGLLAEDADKTAILAAAREARKNLKKNCSNGGGSEEEQEE